MAISISLCAHARALFICFLSLPLCLLVNHASANDLSLLEQRLQRHPSLQSLRFQAQANLDRSTAAMGVLAISRRRAR